LKFFKLSRASHLAKRVHLQLTVMGLGFKILVINFLALKESQGGQVNSAAEIWKPRNENNKHKNIQDNNKVIQKHRSAYFFIQVQKISVIKRQVTCKQYKENHTTWPQICSCPIIASIIKDLLNKNIWSQDWF